MKAQTLKTRLEKRYKGSKNSVSYKLISSLINGHHYLLRTCKTSGTGRFTKNMNYTAETEELLNLVGIKFETGNDSPRGGRTGNFIRVITKII